MISTQEYMESPAILQSPDGTFGPCHLWQLKARSGTLGLDQPKPSASIGREVDYERAGKA